MILDLNKNVTGLDGKEVIDSNMGKLLANYLAGGTSNNPLKFMDWAEKLYKGEAIELDDADYDRLHKEIEGIIPCANLIKAQILKEMKNQKIG